MYIFLIFIAILLIVVPIILYKEMNKSKKMKEEKAQGLWDHIGYEYLPYMNAHPQKVRTVENVSFKLDYRSWSWSIDGTLHYNPAGMYVKFVEISIPNSPTELFVWGKDKSARVKLAQTLFYKDIEISESKVVLKLKTKEGLSDSDYFLTIKNLPSVEANELKNSFV